MAQNFYPVVQQWADATDEERGPFKVFVKELVGYECKVACISNNGWVDVYVLSVDSGEVSDWLEVQPSGAIGVTFNSYPEPEAYGVMALSERCDDFNEELDVEFLDENSEEEDGDSE
jgi:hypothetical protein